MGEIDPTRLFPSLQNYIKERDLTGKYKIGWVEGCLDTLTQSTTEHFVISGTSHIGSSFTTRKARFFWFWMLAIFSIVVVRLLYLQTVKGNYYRAVAVNNSERIIPVPSERGLLYDRRGRQLVKNVPNFSLALVPLDLPRDIEKKNAVINKLSIITGLEKPVIADLIDKYKRYKNEFVVIKEDIDYETALKIQIESAELAGVFIARGSKRLYLSESEILKKTKTNKLETNSTAFSLAPIEGYMAKLDRQELDEFYDKGYLPSDSIGKIGVEKTYESILRGIYGRRRIEVNAEGKEQTVLAEYASTPGSHLELSIDAAAQFELERLIETALKKNNKNQASGIVMDPRGGKILALVSVPSFNNNDFSGGIDQETYSRYLADEDRPLFNRAISGLYPSGSTIKPVFAAAALQEGVITPNTSIISSGGISVGPWFFPDWQAGGHGLTNARRSIAWSVNTFYYYIGGGYGNFVGLGVEKLTEYLKKFGFGTKLGIDLIGEEAGFIPSREWKKEIKGEIWYIGDTYNLSIGQGDLLVTPLQIAAYTSVIANSGTLYKPNVGQAIISSDGTRREEIKTEVIRDNFISKNNIETVRLGMRDCVQYGSCRLLSRLPFLTAGKTGTAQWNNNKENHAWFTSFAPYDNPEIVVTILIEEGEDGSRIALPIAYDFYKWWWGYKIAN